MHGSQLVPFDPDHGDRANLLVAFPLVLEAADIPELLRRHIHPSPDTALANSLSSRKSFGLPRYSANVPNRFSVLEIATVVPVIEHLNSALSLFVRVKRRLEGAGDHLMPGVPGTDLLCESFM